MDLTLISSTTLRAGLRNTSFIDGKYNDGNIIDFYKTLGVGVVFFHPADPGREDRLRQIRAAGAIPFLDDIYETNEFHSSYLMVKRDLGILGQRS